VGCEGVDWIELADRKSQLVSPRRGWDNNTKMYILEVGWGGRDFSD
jgi:hypothetical protein